MQADKRWANADATVVSLELLTVLIGAPLCFYICSLLAKGDRAAQFWIVVLSTGELYGGWMTFCPVRSRGLALSDDRRSGSRALLRSSRATGSISGPSAMRAATLIGRVYLFVRRVLRRVLADPPAHEHALGRVRRGLGERADERSASTDDRRRR